ncbi:sulfate adenylyltransferase subunit CysN [Rubrivirga sp. F394]|uniref:Multifunctional fusion protein n=2 Tax=Rubrivirga litoralis TaxID=3075598 RepID=A0ABU3BPS2_9BACT|nr:sulfate adenylyltransferase subunit CysN [Rubrivirga sp. F394]MDT0631206.1 sulfate adenylyltransferase subunit CysN [Rubrivirga sp. F394]
MQTDRPAPTAPPADGGDAYLDMDLLRFTTAGSVDDGKSTLIGRLLYDSKSIFEDQLAAVEEASRARGMTGDDDVPNLALFTDGLRAEREQGITIDVAYRYFATPRRKFIIADTPGHVQYTRNMVTGASTADLAIILLDAQRGVQTQSKRHGFIASLLGIPHVVVAVNKMDLVDYREDVFDAFRREYLDFAAKLDVKDIEFIPVSALRGDNVVERSERTPWYQGPTLLHHLESVNVAADRNLRDFRFPVQTVIRPDPSFRGFAGTVASGAVRPGEEILALPAGTRSRVASVTTFDGDLDEARAGEAVVVTLEDEIDVSRGDMLVRPGNLPSVETAVEAMVCWMDEEPLQRERHYLLRHTTREVKAFVDELVYRVDVDTLHREDADTLGLNDIGRVRVTTAAPLFFDPYRVNHETGAFVLIDPYSNATVAAGMIRGAARSPDEVAERAARLERSANAASASGAGRSVSPNVTWEGLNVPREDRERRQGHEAAVVWFTGLSGSGKSTVARALERELFEGGVRTMLLDGDQVRHGLNGDLGFSPDDRRENVRRIGEVARLFFESGAVTLCTFVSPYRADRDRVRALVPGGRFFEVHVDVDVETAKARDPKGVYAKAERGEIQNLTGVSAPYEAPDAPEITLRTKDMSVDEAVAAVRAALVAAGVVPE